MENLYSSPGTTFSDASMEGEPAVTPRLFSISGRLGRLRWVLYSFTLMSIGFVLTMAGALLLQAAYQGQSLTVAMALTFLPSVVMLEMLGCIAWMSVRRVHDIGASGWLAFLVLVPLVQVIFLFGLLVWPGARAGNDYGPPPPKDSSAIAILAWLILVLVPVGIMVSLTPSGVQ